MTDELSQFVSIFIPTIKTASSYLFFVAALRHFFMQIHTNNTSLIISAPSSSLL